MKKFICVPMVLSMLLLTACAGKETVPAPEPAAPAAKTAVQAETAPQEAPEPIPEPEPVLEPESVSAPDASDTELEKALECVDQNVSTLYEAVGEPESSHYEYSCSGPGDDGVLYYDGFIVFTYKENGVETVVDAEAE